MRAQEFKPTEEYIQSLVRTGMDVLTWVSVYEQWLSAEEGLLLESAEGGDKYPLLRRLDNAAQLVVSETYIPIFFMLVKDRLDIYDHEMHSSTKAGMIPMKLLERDADTLTFDNHGREVSWPDSRLTNLSYMSVIGTSNTEEYQQLNTLFALELGITLPELKNI